MIQTLKEKGRPVLGLELKKLLAQIFIQNTSRPPPQQMLFQMFHDSQQSPFKGKRKTLPEAAALLT